MIRVILQDDCEIYNDSLNTQFFLDCNGILFPDGEWTDFPVGILHMWIERLVDVIETSQRTFNLSFMDGPYSLKREIVKESIIVKCLDEHKVPPICVCESNESWIAFVEEISKAISSLKKLLDKHDFHDDEMNVLLQKKIQLDEYLTFRQGGMEGLRYHD